MRALRSALPVAAAIVVTWALTTATVAQSSIPNGVFVKNSEGLIWLVLDGQRVKIPIWTATDDEIAALPVPDRWAVLNDAGAIVAGDRPAWFGGAPAAASFSAFEGRWARRDASLRVSANGNATLSWKTGACLNDRDVRPCDRIVDGALEPGGRAVVVLRQVDGSPPKATGRVTETSHDVTIQLGEIAILKVAPDLVLVQQPVGRPLWLCRPPREENTCDV